MTMQKIKNMNYSNFMKKHKPLKKIDIGGTSEENMKAETINFRWRTTIVNRSQSQSLNLNRSPNRNSHNQNLRNT
jgi:hypothetical protein